MFVMFLQGFGAMPDYTEITTSSAKRDSVLIPRVSI